MREEEEEDDDENEDEDDDVEVFVEEKLEEPVLPRTRNRPKKEV